MLLEQQLFQSHCGMSQGQKRALLKLPEQRLFRCMFRKQREQIRTQPFLAEQQLSQKLFRRLLEQKQVLLKLPEQRLFQILFHKLPG